MRRVIAVLAVVSLIAGGCFSFSPPPPVTPTSVTTWGPLGGVSINTGVCAGQVALTAGAAAISDPCFTGNTNVVLCTDATAPNPVRCAPQPGSLSVAGTGSDVVAYARVR